MLVHSPGDDVLECCLGTPMAGEGASCEQPRVLAETEAPLVADMTDGQCDFRPDGRCGCRAQSHVPAARNPWSCIVLSRATVWLPSVAAARRSGRRRPADRRAAERACVVEVSVTQA